MPKAMNEESDNSHYFQNLFSYIFAKIHWNAPEYFMFLYIILSIEKLIHRKQKFSCSKHSYSSSSLRITFNNFLFVFLYQICNLYY